jgi:signal transduction histidine kinase
MRVLAHRFPIKVKAAAALAVPLVLLLGVTALQVGASATNVRDVREQADLATASIGPSGAINALINERNFTTLWMFGVVDAVDLPVADHEDARAATDEAVDAFRSEVTRKGGETERIYGPALRALDELPTLRTTVDEYEGERNILTEDGVGDDVWDGYSRLIDTLAGRTTELAYAVEDGELRRGVQLNDLATRQVDRISKAVRATSMSAARNNGRLSNQDQYGASVLLFAEAERQHARILDLATGPYRALGGELDTEMEATNFFQLARDITETGRVDVAKLLASVSIEDDESYYGFVNDVSGVTRMRADELTGAAESDQRTMVALAAAVLLVAVVLTLFVVRSITRPLRSLTRQARDMAERRLPAAVRSVHERPLGEDVVVPDLEPVHVKTRDEVADVADALNVVQTSALDLAVEQAVMRRNAADSYVNLARRFQALLTRQLDAITELESGETRPGVLADLYVLDHQSTRMRRNAESLLVLAGAEALRRSDHPAAMADVVRAALGEVADYERVVVKGIQYAVVAGPVVADLAHLLAELIDNSLRFSPNDEEVEVRGRAGRDEYQVAVIDRGPGMTPEEIARANRRLASAESHTVAPSSYLGFYVTAVLAARHDITVSLQAAVGRGVSATVCIPDKALVPLGDGELDPPPPAAVVRPLVLRPGARAAASDLARRAQAHPPPPAGPPAPAELGPAEPAELDPAEPAELGPAEVPPAPPRRVTAATGTPWDMPSPATNGAHGRNGAGPGDNRAHGGTDGGGVAGPAGADDPSTDDPGADDAEADPVDSPAR